MKPWLSVFVVGILLGAGCSKTTDPAPTSLRESASGSTGSGGVVRPTGSGSVVQPTGKQSAGDKSKELATDADRLAKDYVTDAKTADATYKDRQVLVTGYVDFVIKDVADQTVVMLEGAPAKSGSSLATYVRCYSHSEAWPRTANELKKGQKVTVRGKCAGFNYAFVDILDCTFVDIRPIEAEQDRASFVKEVEQAGAKVELAPVEFKLDNIEFRMLAPKGATAKSNLFGMLVRQGNDFAVQIRLGRQDFIKMQRDEVGGRALVKADDLVLSRDTTGSFEFATTVVLGHQDFSLLGESYVDGKVLKLTREQCALMLKCAWTLERKDTVPNDPVAALKYLNSDVTEEDGKVVKVRLASYMATDASLALLANLTDITSLELPGFATDDGLKHLHKLKKLQHLSLQGSNYTDVGMAELKHWPALVTLSLRDTGITDKGLANLKAVPQLEVLSINLAPVASDRITDAGLQHLAGLDKLRSLTVHVSNVTDAGLVYLKGLKNLEYLDLSGRDFIKPKITDMGLVHLEGLKHLQVLAVRFQGVTAAGEERLTKAIKGLKVERK